MAGGERGEEGKESPLEASNYAGERKRVDLRHDEARGVKKEGRRREERKKG
jgi:hypothetical protein